MLPRLLAYNARHSVQDLISYVKDTGTEDQLAALFRGGEDLPTVTLPGYNLLQEPRLTLWALPRFVKPFEELLLAYEDLVIACTSRNRSFSPYVRRAWDSRYVQYPRTCTAQWWGPATTLALWGYQLAARELLSLSGGDESELATIDFSTALMPKRAVRLDHNGSKFHFTSKSLWSNLSDRFVPAREMATDARPEIFSVPPVKSNHPLAVFAMRDGMPMEFGHRVSQLLLAQDLGMYGEVTESTFKLRAARKVTNTKRTEDWKTEALTTPQLTMESIEEIRRLVSENRIHLSLNDLQEMLTDRLMTRSQYARRVTGRLSEIRGTVTPRLQAKVLRLLDQMEAECRLALVP